MTYYEIINITFLCPNVRSEDLGMSYANFKTRKGAEKMPEIAKSRTSVIDPLFCPKAEYVKIADWQGKSLTFILADEVFVKQKPGLLKRRKNTNEKKEG